MFDFARKTAKKEKKMWGFLPLFILNMSNNNIVKYVEYEVCSHVTLRVVVSWSSPSPEVLSAALQASNRPSS